jgi:hypothetical protein
MQFATHARHAEVAGPGPGVVVQIGVEQEAGMPHFGFDALPAGFDSGLLPGGGLDGRGSAPGRDVHRDHEACAQAPRHGHRDGDGRIRIFVLHPHHPDRRHDARHVTGGPDCHTDVATVKVHRRLVVPSSGRDHQACGQLLDGGVCQTVVHIGLQTASMNPPAVCER